MSSTHLHKPVKEVNKLSLYYVGEIAVIVMNRGQNRLNIEFCDAFHNLLDEVEGNDSCKGLISTGVAKFYGNGLDVEWMAQQTDAVLVDFFSKYMSLLKRILILPMPTLAAINGHCYAGSGLLAFVHDLRTMRNDKGWLCFNEVFINRRFSEANYKLLRSKFGSGMTSTDAVILGRRYSATEAQENKMVHTTCSENLLIPESIRLMKSYSGKYGYERESIYNLKADMFEDVVETFDAEIKGLHDGLQPRPSRYVPFSKL